MHLSGLGCSLALLRTGTSLRTQLCLKCPTSDSPLQITICLLLLTVTRLCPVKICRLSSLSEVHTLPPQPGVYIQWNQQGHKMKVQKGKQTAYEAPLALCPLPFRHGGLLASLGFAKWLMACMDKAAS